MYFTISIDAVVYLQVARILRLVFQPLSIIYSIIPKECLSLNWYHGPVVGSLGPQIPHVQSR